jgi:hypothetical protein
VLFLFVAGSTRRQTRNQKPQLEKSYMSDELLTAEETAAELAKQGVIKDVKPFTIKRWGRIGLIPVADLGHRTKRYHLPSVQAALLKRQKKARAAR